MQPVKTPLSARRSLYRLKALSFSVPGIQWNRLNIEIESNTESCNAGGGGSVTSATTVSTVALGALDNIRARAAFRGLGLRSTSAIECLACARNGRERAVAGKYPVATPMSRWRVEKLSAKKGSRTVSVLQSILKSVIGQASEMLISERLGECDGVGRLNCTHGQRHIYRRLKRSTRTS